MHGCEVLNVTYDYLHDINPQDAIIHILAGRAVLEEGDPSKRFRTVTEEYPYPISIRLTNHVKIPYRKHQLKLSKHNIYVRDDYRCQYCGRHVSEFMRKERLSIDHVIPKSQGGRNTWENEVLACSSCNHKKANRTPREAGMKLLRKPYKPALEQLKAKKLQHRLTISW